MNRPSARELVLLCVQLLLLAGAGFLLSRCDPLDSRRVSLRLNITTPTNMESLDGAGAALPISLQGPQTNRWELLNAATYLQLETPHGVFDSRKRNFPRDNTWIYREANARRLHARAAWYVALRL